MTCAVATGRRRARRLLVVGAVASLAAAFVAPGARAQEDEPVTLPDSFVGFASASALDVQLLTPALLPVENLFAFRVAEGRGSYEPSNQESRASLLFPGEGLVKGPGLACDQFRANVPPEGEPLFGPLVRTCAGYAFPLAVYADSLQGEGSTEGAVALGTAGDPISLEATGARARAGIEATTTDSQVSDLRIVGAPGLGSLDALLQAAGEAPTDSTLVAADGMTSTTDQRIVDDALVVVSRATVTGLRLLGGLVQVGSIVSTSTLRSAPGAEPELDSTVALSGVTVAGTPAQVTEDGLVVAGGPSGPLDQQLANRAAEALAEAGLRLTLLPTEQGELQGVPFATAGGVLIELSAPIEGLPPVPGPLGDIDMNGRYGVRVLAGVTGARGFAEDFDAAAPARGGSSPGVAGGALGPTGPGSLGGSPGAAPGGATAPPSAAAPDAPAAPSPVRALADVLADRLGFLYLSFTLSVLALCVAPRLTLPSRLPSGR
jgi:hypothetical protein